MHIEHFLSTEEYLKVLSYFQQNSFRDSVVKPPPGVQKIGTKKELVDSSLSAQDYRGQNWDMSD